MHMNINIYIHIFMHIHKFTHMHIFMIFYWQLVWKSLDESQSAKLFVQMIQNQKTLWTFFLSVLTVNT